jgi:hypothetical protein
LKLSVDTSVAELARRYYGDRRRSFYLAAVNGLRADAVASSGKELLMPVQVFYRAMARESLPDIAAAFFGDARKADLLRAYNFLGSVNFVQKGQTIAIPTSTLRARAAGSTLRLETGRQPTKAEPHVAAGPAGAAPSAPSTGAAGEQINRGLLEGEALFRRGEYGKIVPLCLGLAQEHPNPQQTTELYRLLAFSFVALGHPDIAELLFREILRQTPAFQLDPKTVSPKIQRVLDGARRIHAQPATPL